MLTYSVSFRDLEWRMNPKSHSHDLLSLIRSHRSAKLVGILTWPFWSGEGWLRVTGRENPRSDSLWQGRGHAFIGLTSENPTSFSWLRAKRDVLILWHGKGKNELCELSEVYSAWQKPTGKGFTTVFYQLRERN